MLGMKGYMSHVCICLYSVRSSTKYVVLLAVAVWFVERTQGHTYGKLGTSGFG